MDTGKLLIELVQDGDERVFVITCSSEEALVISRAFKETISDARDIQWRWPSDGGDGLYGPIESLIMLRKEPLYPVYAQASDVALAAIALALFTYTEHLKHPGHEVTAKVYQFLNSLLNPTHNSKIY